MYETLQRLQSEKKCIKSDPVEYAMKVQAAKQQKERDEKLEVALKSEKPMADVVRDIEEVFIICLSKIRLLDVFSFFSSNLTAEGH